MKYVSTRGDAPSLKFEDVLLAGLARDGGLYVPETWPQFSADEIRDFQGQSYCEIAQKVMAPFVGECIDEGEFKRLIEDAYAQFQHDAVAPLIQLDENLWVLELFHGPTLAFKDFAMQILSRLMDRALKNRGERATIVGATSGDTGGAAIEAFRGLEQIDIFILHPRGRVSDVQRRQMTTASEDNVFNIALEGTFDDCQAVVKGLFNDLEFRDQYKVTGVNSINWARIMAQIVYYFTSATALGSPDRPVSFAVPTGNFGDIFAGFVAAKMGLPIKQLVVATNVNDILVRTFDTGRYEPQTVTATFSPSMDIQVSSNFERLMFEMAGRDAGRVSELMASLVNEGHFKLSDNELAPMRDLFSSQRISEDETVACINEQYQNNNYMTEPHSAIAIEAARRSQKGATPMIALSTAHPAKFPDVVVEATNAQVEQPARLKEQLRAEERVQVLSNEKAKVADYIAHQTRVGK